MKTLIAYYSFTGNNKALAEKLEEKLTCDLVRIQTAGKRTGLSILWDLIFKRSPRLKEYSITFSDYDHVILIAPVWAGKIATPMEMFLRRERDNIPHYSFITLCGGVAGQKEKIRESLASAMLRNPVAVEELWVNDLLLPEQKDKVRFTSNYRIRDEDWVVFNPKINAFLDALAFPTKLVYAHK